MIVRCVREAASDVRRAARGASAAHDYDVVVGTQYLVYGIRGLAKTLWVDLLSDFGYIRSVPLGLFEILDGRMPLGWSFGLLSSNGDWALWPREFWRPYFHDDLSEGDPDRNGEVMAVKEQLAELHGTDAGLGSGDAAVS